MDSRKLLKDLSAAMLAPFDLTLVRRSYSHRTSLSGCLKNLRSCGFMPRTVLDIGAAYGRWTLQCQKIFPEAEFVLIEPLQEYKSFLDDIAKQQSMTYIEAAAAREDGTQTINVHRDLVGTSFYSEAEGPHVDGVQRVISTKRLDSISADTQVAAPLLLKIDVQGAELDVLAGGPQTLASAAVVILETSFFDFFRGAATFADTVAYMKERGFVPYDLFGLKYRPLDNALAQADVIFVSSDNRLRHNHFYASRSQRQMQDAALSRGTKPKVRAPIRRRFRKKALVSS